MASDLIQPPSQHTHARAHARTHTHTHTQRHTYVHTGNTDIWRTRSPMYKYYVLNVLLVNSREVIAVSQTDVFHSFTIYVLRRK